MKISRKLKNEEIKIRIEDFEKEHIRVIAKTYELSMSEYILKCVSYCNQELKNNYNFIDFINSKENVNCNSTNYDNIND